MADDRIEIEITLDDGSVKKGFANIQREAKSSSRELGDSFDKNFINRFKVGLGAATAAVAGLAAAVGVGRVLGAATEAAAKQEDAINKLNTSLALAGSFSEEASRGIQNFASQLQATSTIGDETTLELVALARNFTTTNEEAVKLTKAAADLSAATGLSLDGAVKNLGKTFAGLTGELGESVPALRNLTPEALKSGAAIDLILQRFGGAAQAQTNTFSGALTQLKNTFGDLQEEIGFTITSSPALINVFKTITAFLGEAITKLSDLRGGGDFIGDLLQSAFRFAIVLNDFIIKPIEIFTKAFVLGVQVIGAGLTSIISIIGLVGRAISENIVAPVVGFLSDDLANIVGFIDKDFANTIRNFSKNSTDALTSGFDTVANKAGELRDSLIQDVLASSDQVFTTTVGDTINNALLALNEAAENTEGIKNKFSELSAAAANSARTATTEWFEFSINFAKTSKATGKLAIDLSQQFKQAFVTSASQSIQLFTNALMQGKLNFELFAKSILSILGDLAIQVGQVVLAAGIAMSSVFNLQPIQAIIAGAALIALGTVLKSFAGGGGAGAQGAGAGGGGAGGGIGGGIGGPGETSELTEVVDETEATATRTAVNINVQGNILDRRETGLEIAQIINESFDNDGVLITG